MRPARPAQYRTQRAGIMVVVPLACVTAGY